MDAPAIVVKMPAIPTFFREKTCQRPAAPCEQRWIATLLARAIMNQHSGRGGQGCHAQTQAFLLYKARAADWVRRGMRAFHPGLGGVLAGPG